MLLKGIVLENFRQYKGTQIIKFSTDKENNVTVIIGQNTGGKTTLVRAFIWALYGENPFVGELINIEQSEKLKSRVNGATENVSVTIQLVHKSIDYKITRSIIYENKNGNIKAVNEGFDILRDETGEGYKTVGYREREHLVQSILPRNLADYFFFWGERIENLDSKKNISDAVKNFLGLSAIDSSKKHLKSLISTYNKQIATLEQNDISSINYSKQLEEIESKIKQLEDQLDDKEKDAEYFQEKYNFYEEELLRNSQTADSERRLQEYSKRQITLEESIENDYIELLKSFNREPFKYIVDCKLKESLLSTLEHIPVEEKGLAYSTKKSIMELVTRKKCVCGRPLEKNTDAYDHIMKELEKLPPNSISALVDTFKKEIQEKNSFANLYKTSYLKTYKTYSDNLYTLEDLKDDIESEKKKIDSNVDVAGIQKNKTDYYRRYITKVQEIQKCEDDINLCNIKHDRVVDKINHNAAFTEKSKKVRKYKSYAEAVIKNIENDYNVKEENIKNELNELVNVYFNRIYHGDRKLELDNNYQTQSSSNVGGKLVKTEESPGLKTVKNFAYIAALVEMAKERRNEKNNDIFEIEPYPLVLDAPFSQADEIHVPNICELISSIVEQTIIVVMEKDWSYAKNIMKKKVGKSYILTKNSETFTTIKELNLGE